MSTVLQSLRENLRSTLLSTIGVAVASLAIILLVSIGLGVQNDITGQIDTLGADLLIVVPGKVDMGSFNPNFAGKSFLSESSAAEIQELPGISNTSLFSFAGGGIQAGELDAYPIIIATSPSWFTMQPTILSAGEFFTSKDDGERVCVVGSIAADQIFPNSSAIGQNVTINGADYKVKGVIKDEKAESSPFSAFSLVNVVYIPISTVQKYEENTQIDRILVQIDNTVDPEILIPTINQTLGKTLQETQYSVLTQDDLLKLVYQILGILATLVVGLTSIALAVGGLGIMTVMLMSVGERTKEIGVRLAVGASRKAIFRHFLAESAIIGLIGVTIGLTVSLVVISVISTTTSIKPLVTPQTISLTFIIGIGLGSLFGILPAMKAARLHPVECLRNE